MGKPQIIHTDGEDLVVLSRRDYEALCARAGEEAAEDAMTARIVAETRDAIARGDDVALPGAVWDAIEAGENAVRVLRKHRGLTQAALAEAVGVSQGYIAELEGGRKSGTPETLRALAKALGVPLDVLVE
ncbi:helix-turn-helix domain-containing protein [Chelatococcus sp. XZ-Ab1]|uniref:helix-turn-helix domain-containing protein n=1 Tax=Chelatococcus sp. XZ-Ab1 TaxID=3034027 RepID=UPI0023E44242|nr:helix-turn-helix domain-containing protein [Chelatococcus sp. XZ-Ab1]